LTKGDRLAGGHGGSRGLAQLPGQLHVRAGEVALNEAVRLDLGDVDHLPKARALELLNC